MLRGLGTVPGPIVMGALMDRTCILWKDDNGADADAGERGACLVYDHAAMSAYVLAVVVAWRIAAAVFFAIALYCNR